MDYTDSPEGQAAMAQAQFNRPIGELFDAQRHLAARMNGVVDGHKAGYRAGFKHGLELGAIAASLLAALIYVLMGGVK